MPQQKITSYDVAKLAGVSQATVSRAFDPNGNVAEATRTKVLATAKQLGYEPSAIARSLTTDRSDIIGLVMGDISRSMFYPKVLNLVSQKLQALNKQVLFFNSHNTRPVDEILPRVISYHVDALVVASTTPGRQIVDQFIGKGVPMLLINRILEDSGAYSICSDNKSGGQRVAKSLITAGHKRLAFVAGVRVTSTNIDRETGFLEEVDRMGYTPPIIVEGNYTYDSGYAAALELLDRDDPPDAIFCAADIMALGAMDAARHQLGIHIPEELSIIGYDDIPMSSWSSYNLTTIRQPIEIMVEQIINIISTAKQDGMTEKIHLLPAELVVRNSARLEHKQA